MILYPHISGFILPHRYYPFKPPICLLRKTNKIHEKSLLQKFDLKHLNPFQNQEHLFRVVALVKDDIYANTDKKLNYEEFLKNYLYYKDLKSMFEVHEYLNNNFKLVLQFKKIKNNKITTIDRNGILSIEEHSTILELKKVPQVLKIALTSDFALLNKRLIGRQFIHMESDGRFINMETGATDNSIIDQWSKDSVHIVDYILGYKNSKIQNHSQYEAQIFGIFLTIPEISNEWSSLMLDEIILYADKIREFLKDKGKKSKEYFDANIMRLKLKGKFYTVEMNKKKINFLKPESIQNTPWMFKYDDNRICIMYKKGDYYYAYDPHKSLKFDTWSARLIRATSQDKIMEIIMNVHVKNVCTDIIVKILDESDKGKYMTKYVRKLLVLSHYNPLCLKRFVFVLKNVNGIFSYIY